MEHRRRRRSRRLQGAAASISASLILLGLGPIGARAALPPRTCASTWTLSKVFDSGKQIDGITVASDGSTWAAGDGILRRQAERWRWVDGPVGWGFNAIGGTSASDLWAVGADIGKVLTTLAVHYDGTAWHRVATPSPRGKAWLSAVSMTSTDDGWAVGARLFGGTFHPVAQHWNGERWTRAAFTRGEAELESVDALGPSDVWAAGSTGPGLTSTPALFHWDGSAWAFVPSPAVGDGWFSALVTTGSTVWAVGTGSQGGFVERWNGSAWHIERLWPGVELQGAFRDASGSIEVVGETGPNGGDVFAAHKQGSWVTDAVEVPPHTFAAMLVTGAAAAGGPGWIVGVSTGKRGHSRFFIDGMEC